MAVVKMRKVFIIAHRHDQTQVVNDLQDSGLIEVSEIALTDPSIKGAPEKLNAARAEQLSLESTKVQYVIDFLKAAKTQKIGFIEGLMKERLLIDRRRFFSVEQNLDFESLYAKCHELDDALSAIEKEKKVLRERSAELSTWTAMDAAFDDLRKTTYAGFAVGVIDAHRLDGLTDSLEAACPESEIVFVGPPGRATPAVIVYYAPHKPVVERTLAAADFDFIDITSWKMEPARELKVLEGRLTELTERTATLKTEVSHLLSFKEDAVILRDWLRTRGDRYAAQARFGQTRATFALQGWIEQDKEASLAKRLEGLDAVVDFSFSEPGPEDNVPINLKNASWLRPFESLTRLYGVPNYREIDPTPTMGIYFFMFFGIALGDFGYGLVLILFCLWLKRKYLFTQAGRQWLNIFMLGGVSSMIFGALTASYFGIDANSLPAGLKSVMIIDPLQDAFIFLIATWAIGVAHIVTGLVLEFLDSVRQNDYAAAFYENLSLLVLFVSAVVAGAGWLAVAVFASKAAIFGSLMSIGVKALGITAIVYVLFSGGFFSGYVDIAKGLLSRRSTPDVEVDVRGSIIALAVLAAAIAAVFGPLSLGPVAVGITIVGLFVSKPTRKALGALGLGLYNLYGMSSFIGDVLSYSRLMALGLATFLIGFVINTLAGLVAGASLFGLPVGILLAALIAIPLHIVNLVINLLGAFVHPLRLQFVEYFSKFYEDGGRAFKPFSFETEHLLFKEEKA